MKQPIVFIGISDETTAGPSGMRRTTRVRFHRVNEAGKWDKSKSFETAPLFEDEGKISAASLARAHRAQMVLTRPECPPVEMDDEDEDTDENPYLLTGPELSRTVARRIQGYNP